LITLAVLGSSAWQLIRVHPFELSYYNELIGGARGARKAGFEMSYWYDVYTLKTVEVFNKRLPQGATIDFLSLSIPPVFTEYRSLGHLRSDVAVGAKDPYRFPFAVQLMQDSKITTHGRLLFAMKPWLVIEPPQLDGVRVAWVDDPVTVARVWALQLLTGVPSIPFPDPPRAPDWVHRFVPWLGRLWGEGLIIVPPPVVYEPIFDWARRDPEGLRAAARKLVERRPIDDDTDALRLQQILMRFDTTEKVWGLYFERLLRARPEALLEAIEILIQRPDDLRKVLTRVSFIDLEELRGYLDQQFADAPQKPSAKPGPSDMMSQ
jgi:hypothetical protein